MLIYNPKTLDIIDDKNKMVLRCFLNQDRICTSDCAAFVYREKFKNSTLPARVFFKCMPQEHNIEVEERND